MEQTKGEGGDRFEYSMWGLLVWHLKKVTSKYAHIIHLNQIGEEGRRGGEIQIIKTR